MPSPLEAPASEIAADTLRLWLAQSGPLALVFLGLLGINLLGSLIISIPLGLGPLATPALIPTIAIAVRMTQQRLRGRRESLRQSIGHVGLRAWEILGVTVIFWTVPTLAFQAIVLFSRYALPLYEWFGDRMPMDPVFSFVLIFVLMGLLAALVLFAACTGALVLPCLLAGLGVAESFLGSWRTIMGLGKEHACFVAVSFVVFMWAWRHTPDIARILPGDAAVWLVEGVLVYLAASLYAVGAAVLHHDLA